MKKSEDLNNKEAFGAPSFSNGGQPSGKIQTSGRFVSPLSSDKEHSVSHSSTDGAGGKTTDAGAVGSASVIVSDVGGKVGVSDVADKARVTGAEGKTTVSGASASASVTVSDARGKVGVSGTGDKTTITGAAMSASVAISDVGGKVGVSGAGGKVGVSGARGKVGVTGMGARKISRVLFFSLSGLMLLTSAIWGISFVVVKDSLNKIGATWMIAIRFSIAALFLSLIYIKKLFKTDKKTFLRGVLLGFFLFTAYLLQTIGCKYTTAGKNAFLTTIYVFLVPIMCVPLMHSRLKLRALFFAFLALVGLALLSLGGSADSIGSFNRGDALTILCGIFFALHMACGKSFTQNSDPMILSVWQFITAGVLGFALAPILDGTGEVILSALKNRSVIISLLYLGIFSSMFGFVAQNVGLKYLPSNVASLLLSFESVFGALFGVILLSEPLTPLMGAGCALMTLALVLTEVFG